MADPVTASDGYTYDRESIVAWLEHNTASPTTNEDIGSTVLVPNDDMRKEISEWRTIQRSRLNAHLPTNMDVNLNNLAVPVPNGNGTTLDIGNFGECDKMSQAKTLVERLGCIMCVVLTVSLLTAILGICGIATFTSAIESDPGERWFRMGCGLLFGGLAVSLITAGVCYLSGVWGASRHFGFNHIWNARRLLAACGHALPPEPPTADDSDGRGGDGTDDGWGRASELVWSAPAVLGAASPRPANIAC